MESDELENKLPRQSGRVLSFLESGPLMFTHTSESSNLASRYKEGDVDMENSLFDPVKAVMFHLGDERGEVDVIGLGKEA